MPSNRSRTSLAWEYPEPVARRLLRIAFGIFWIFDGLLQTQSSMPLGLTGGVITPSASSSPGWVQHLVNSGVTIWNDHPVSAAASAVWIQVGIGLFLLVAPRGRWSRTAGLVSAGWGLVVWSFGEAFGGIFGHGSSWLFGSPGAAVFYVVAGGLVALPDRAWETERLGRVVVRATGVFFVAMGVLEAWPGRGFWSGRPGPDGTGATLSAMETPDGPAVPAVGDRVLGAGVRILRRRPRLAGQLRGRGRARRDRRLLPVGPTGAGPRRRDRRRGPVPRHLGAGPGLRVLRRRRDRPELDAADARGVHLRVPRHGPAPGGVRAPVGARRGGARRGAGAGRPWRDRIATGVPEPVATTGRTPARPAQRLLGLHPSYLVRCMAALGAVGIVLVGAAPMALAAANPTADPIINSAANGSPNLVDSPAPGFTLTNESGATVSLHDLAGRTVVLTFLDPTCTSDCPLIAQELRVADQQLGADAAKVALVSIVEQPPVHVAGRHCGLRPPGGHGPAPELELPHRAASTSSTHAWDAYGVQTAVSPAGAMVAHSDLVFLIDRTGRLRVVLTSDPGGQGDAALHSSFSSTVTQQVRQLVRT